MNEETLSPEKPIETPVAEPNQQNDTNVQVAQENVLEMANIEPQSVSDVVPIEEKKPENTGTKEESIRNPDGTIKKGHTLNPAGRPKGARSLSTILKEYLINTSRKTADGDTVTLAEGVMRKLVDNALRGKEKSIEILLERVDGKVDSNINFKGYLGVEQNMSDEEKAQLLGLIYGTDNDNNIGQTDQPQGGGEDVRPEHN